MSNLTCEQFKILVQLYNLKYMCLTYDIVCQNDCMEHDNCYCQCTDDQIFCVSHHYFFWRLFSVLLTAMFVSCCCYGCIMFFRRSNKNVNSTYAQPSNILPPSYNHSVSKNNNLSQNQQTQEKKYDEITTYPIDRS